MFTNLHPKCSNPSCAESFSWHAGGRLFRFRRASVTDGIEGAHKNENGSSHHVEHFWLCERCSHVFMLDYTPGLGVSIRPLWHELPEAGHDMHLLAS